jgi:hypothetical protein
MRRGNIASERSSAIAWVGGCPLSRNWQASRTPSVAAPGIALPAGHPFSFKPMFNGIHWSTTIGLENPLRVAVVDFERDPDLVGARSKDNNTVKAWCVRGGQGTVGN